MALIKKTHTDIAVTIDFLRTIPDFDITVESELAAALYAIGFRSVDKEMKPVRVERTMCNVRLNNAPYKYRPTLVFSGTMREDFKYASMYDGVDILDVDVYTGSDAVETGGMKFDIPVLEKANTRKYTRRADREDFIDMSQANLEVLSEIMGE